MQGVRVVLQDGAAHAVDSSELAFRIAAVNAFRQVCGGVVMVMVTPVVMTGIV
jgi:elongation factor G